jgi:hypothetical protein
MNRRKGWGCTFFLIVFFVVLFAALSSHDKKKVSSAFRTLGTVLLCLSPMSPCFGQYSSKTGANAKNEKPDSRCDSGLFNGSDGRIRIGDLILTNFKGGRSDSVVLCHLYNPKFVFSVRPVQIMPH